MYPNLDLFWVHGGLAIALFGGVNWLGRHAVKAGYLQLSLYAQADEAPAFNFVFRVLAPVVYLHIVAAVLYSGGLDWAVSDFTGSQCTTLQFVGCTSLRRSVPDWSAGEGSSSTQLVRSPSRILLTIESFALRSTYCRTSPQSRMNSGLQLASSSM